MPSRNAPQENPNVLVLRARGWELIHHRDVERFGEWTTEWFYAHSSGRFVVGSGASYADAWADAAARATAPGADQELAPGTSDEWMRKAIVLRRCFDAWQATRHHQATEVSGWELQEVWKAGRNTFVEALQFSILAEEPYELDRHQEAAAREILDMFLHAGIVDAKGKPLKGTALLDRARPRAVPEAAGDAPEDFLAALWDVLETAGAGDRHSLPEGRLARLEDFVRLQATEAWRPMVDAPRAGTARTDVPDVDLWHRRNGRYVDCYWDASLGAWMERRGGRATNVGRDEDFTHWRRQPVGPQGTETIGRR